MLSNTSITLFTIVYAAAVEYPDDGLTLRVDRMVKGGDALEAHATALVYVHIAVLHLAYTYRTRAAGRQHTVST